MEAMSAPDIIGEADSDLDEFMERIGLEAPAGDAQSDVDARIDYLLEQLAQIGEQIASNDDVARRRMDMIRDWQQGENAKLERKAEWLRGEVAALVPGPDDFRRIYGKKSRTLPNGSVGYRASRDTVEITDASAALEYAREHGLEIRITERVNKTPLIEHAQQTGTMEGDGWEFVPGSDSFFVKAGG